VGRESTRVALGVNPVRGAELFPKGPDEIMSATGYSGKAVVEKLGIRPGAEILLVSAPQDFLRLVGPLPDDVKFVTSVTDRTIGAHVFATLASALAAELAKIRSELGSCAFVWVSWPKKAARVDTDVTEKRIREIALPMGFVDVKVCAVSDVWSGLKLVVRKELR